MEQHPIQSSFNKTYIDISCFLFPQTVSGNTPFLHTRADNGQTFLENLQESHFYPFGNLVRMYDRNQYWWSSIAVLWWPEKHYKTSLCTEQLAGYCASGNNIRITDNIASSSTRHPTFFSCCYLSKFCRQKKSVVSTEFPWLLHRWKFGHLMLVNCRIFFSI